MKTEKDAVFLAELMVETGERMGKQVVALITDMDQPLGNMVGNSLEVIEALEVLRGRGPEDLKELCLHLAGWMLYIGRVSKSVAEGKQQSIHLISSGKALEKFRQMVELQGGDAKTIDDPKRLPRALHTRQLKTARAGFISAMRCEQIGTACVILGGGRERKEDSVDPAVGIVLHKKVGDRVSGGEPLATVYYNADARLERAQRLILASYEFADAAPKVKRPLIHRVIENAGEKR
jgi:thymidine phosphorylase